MTDHPTLHECECGATLPTHADLLTHHCLAPLSADREQEARDIAAGNACYACAVGVPHTCVHRRAS